jgi:hypothetical protein
MGNQFIDMTSKRCGRLLVLRRTDDGKNKGAAWLCKCDCGKDVIVSGSSMRRGNTLSCGCLRTGLRVAQKEGTNRDLTGQTFGMLTVIGLRGWAVRGRKNSSVKVWKCRCTCGMVRGINARELIYGKRTDCGCVLATKTPITASCNPEYKLFHSARKRAYSTGVPFNIKVSDIFVPNLCPCLGIPLIRGQRVICNNSPTLDRIVPELGYVKGNVWVISSRANRIKTNASLAELKLIATALEKMLNIQTQLKTA